MILGRLWFSY